MAKGDNQHAVLHAAKLSDTASRLVEVNIMVTDWLANIRVTTKLRESREVLKSASKIRKRDFYDNVTTA